VIGCGYAALGDSLGYPGDGLLVSRLILPEQRFLDHFHMDSAVEYRNGRRLIILSPTSR
tara:strand:+ start:778 stop:954 length:177 start_codon:yes stop_codon:yes gene_type:complete